MGGAPVIEALATLPPVPPAALLAPLLVKSKKSSRRRSHSWVAPAVVVGAWVLLSDGRQCKVSAVLPDGKVFCSEVQQ